MAVTWGTPIPRTSRVVHAAPGPDPDEDRRGALLHQREGRLGIGRVADGDRDRHVPGEVRERQRVVLGREVAGGRHLALDQEEVRAVLRAERPEPAGGARRGGDRGAGPGGVDLVEPARDELLADRLQVGLGEQVLDLVVGRRGDAGEDLVRLVVARLDALEVEDREATEPRQRPGHPRIHDGVHGGREDRDREVDAAEDLGEIDVGRLDRVGARRERDVLEAVGRADRVHLGPEHASRRGTRGRGRGGGLGTLDHVALLCRLTVGCLSTPSLPARQLRRPEVRPGPGSVEGQLEPAGALRLGQVVADPLDGGPVARPDDLLVGLVEVVPAGVVVLAGQARLGARLEADREDGGRDDRVVRTARGTG